jgi:hypothetical protein
MLPDTDIIALKAGQIATVLLCVPLIKGVSERGKHTIQIASLATLDTSSEFDGTGYGRTRVVSFPAEPAIILVLCTLTLVAHAAVPFVVNWTLAAPGYLFTPTPWLLAIALLLVILAVDVVLSLAGRRR